LHAGIYPLFKDHDSLAEILKLGAAKSISHFIGILMICETKETFELNK
jgi:hypothetical protein